MLPGRFAISGSGQGLRSSGGVVDLDASYRVVLTGTLVTGTAIGVPIGAEVWAGAAAGIGAGAVPGAGGATGAVAGAHEPLPQASQPHGSQQRRSRQALWKWLSRAPKRRSKKPSVRG